MFFVVDAAHEVGRLKLRVATIDPEAFVSISNAQEVFGERTSAADREAAGSSAPYGP